MRVFDMRLIGFAILILLTAAMPANCAEEPGVWFGVAAEQGGMQAVREAIQRRAAGRTFAHVLRDFNNEAVASKPESRVPCGARAPLLRSQQ
jgi:hypothetical protein